jgi:hypothetical protein
MNIRAKIFGNEAEEPILRAKQPKGARADTLSSVAVGREESRRSNDRQRDRHRLTAEQAIVRHNGREHVIELVNLSAGGAMVRGKFEPMMWDQVGLVLGDEGEIDCAVRWLKEDRVGLEFAHETRIDCDQESRDELLRAVIRKSFPDAAGDPLGEWAVERAEEPAEEPDSRIAPRHPLIWSGVVYHDYECEPVRLRNVSATGALVQSGHPLPEGATVYLDLGAAGKFDATVRWTRGGQSGLSFTEPFDIQCLAKARPDIADNESRAEAFGNQEPWAPGWRRATIDEMARSLGG